MELEKFSIKDIVLGTKELSNMTSKFLLNSFNYIETSISYNNDFELGKVLDKKTKIISSISSLSQYELMINYHLTWLKRDKIDILLVDSKASWKDKDFLSLVLRRGELFEEIGVTNVDSINDIKRIQDLGINPDWASIVINPTCFNLELITFLRESGIKIISYGILGGYMAKTNIEVYTLQFLLSFAAVYSDLVCISGNSCEEVLSNKVVLEKCINKELTTDLKSIYLFNSSRIVKRAPLTPLPLYRYLPANNFVLKLKGSKSICSPILSLDGNLEAIPEEDTIKDNLESVVYEYLNQLILPEDCIPDSLEAFAFWRYNIVAMISLLRGSRSYRYSYELCGNTFLIYRKKKFGFNKKKSSGTYILALVEGDKNPFFRKIEENSDQNT